MFSHLSRSVSFSLSCAHNFFLPIRSTPADPSRHKVSVSSLHVDCYYGKGDQMKCRTETVCCCKYIFNIVMPCSLVGTYLPNYMAWYHWRPYPHIHNYENITSHIYIWQFQYLFSILKLSMKNIFNAEGCSTITAWKHFNFYCM